MGVSDGNGMAVFTTCSVEDTVALGRRLADGYAAGDCVAFVSQLGAGKTHFIKGVVAALSGEEATSPTFTLVNEYAGPFPIYHIDLYRLESAAELDTIGWRDYLLGDGLLLVEWADRFAEALAECNRQCRIDVEPNDARRFEIT